MIGGGHPRARLTRHPPQVKRFMHSWEPSGGLGGDKSKGTAAAGGKRTAMASAAAASSADARSSALQARPAIAHLRALPVCAAQSTSSAAPRLLARGVPPQIGANGRAANGRRGRGVRGQARVWPCYVRGPKVEPFRSYFQECFELDSAIVRFAQTGEGATARLIALALRATSVPWHKFALRLGQQLGAPGVGRGRGYSLHGVYWQCGHLRCATAPPRAPAAEFGINQNVFITSLMQD